MVLINVKNLKGACWKHRRLTPILNDFFLFFQNDFSKLKRNIFIF